MRKITTMEMCRACLSTEADLLPFDEKFITNYKLLTNLDVRQKEDKMPNQACQACVAAIIFFMDFRARAISSEMTLKNLTLMKLKVDFDGTADLDNKVVDVVTKEVKLEFDQDLDQELFNVSCETTDYEDNSLYTPNIDEDVKPKRSKRVENQKKSIVTKLVLDDDKIINCDIKSKKRKRDAIPYQIEKKVLDNEDKEFICGLCPMTFEDISELKDHVECHAQDRQCLTCKELFTMQQQVFAHRLIHVPNKQKRCHMCNKKFLTTVSLEYHYMKIHFGEVAPKLMCKYCLKFYDSSRKLRSHISSMHINEYQCDTCSKRYKNKTLLRSHIKSHSDERSYVCDLCTFTCKYPSGLKDHHARKHNATTVTCKACSRLFENQEKFNQHKCTGVTCICPVCGKNISSRKSFNRHVQSHSDILKYECHRCPAKFKTKSGLKLHHDRHDGNKTYHCEYCPKRFYSGSVLVRHRRTHTGEKPYVCKTCNKGFTGKHNLKFHMRVHGEYLIVKRDTLSEVKIVSDVI